MPKDEFDFEDPLELNGVALRTQEDTTDLMCECFIEEFMRLRYAPGQILGLFRNPHYLGMRLVLQNRGEEFVRDRIAEVFSRWGRHLDWTPTAPAASTTVHDVPDKDSPISHPRPNPVTAHAVTGLGRGIKGEGQ